MALEGCSFLLAGREGYILVSGMVVKEGTNPTRAERKKKNKYDRLKNLKKGRENWEKFLRKWLCQFFQLNPCWMFFQNLWLKTFKGFLVLNINGSWESLGFEHIFLLNSKQVDRKSCLFILMGLVWLLSYVLYWVFIFFNGFSCFFLILCPHSIR